MRRRLGSKTRCKLLTWPWARAGLAGAQGLCIRPFVYQQHEGLLSLGPWGQWHPDLKFAQNP